MGVLTMRTASSHREVTTLVALTHSEERKEVQHVW